MTEIVNEVRKGFYLDSVALMRLSAEISALGGIEEAVLMIGTPSNLQIMQDAGVLNATGESASPNDLVIALRADGKSNANRALAHANKSLEGGALKSADSGTAKARTLRGGLEAHPDANLALISTPGSYAAREARTALELGLNVMIFSDNVSIEQEAALKATAQKNKLLVMGPDCGTAYIDHIPLAFANALVTHPDIDSEHGTTKTTGVVAASGTGLQEFAVLLNKLGGNLKHGIGVGGRDLSDAIGGISTLTAIDLLANDKEIDQIVLISKPPGPDTARLVFDKLASCGKPVITCVFGLNENHPNKTGNASNLREAAEQATGKSLPEKTDIKSQGKSMAATLSGKQSKLIGLYTGGTLCTESQLILQAAGLKITSNATAPGSAQSTPQIGASHHIIDLGADEYTVGRPHPMMEPLVRVEPLQQALNDPSIAVVLLDVVLGYGAHENPAKAVAEAVQNATKTNTHNPVVIASVCGTVADPQGLQQQHNLLSDSGITVCNSNTEAAELAAEVIKQIN